MKKSHLQNLVILLFICSTQIVVSQTKKTVEPFNKVIISPHIETTFVQGSEESVTILENTLSDDKVNIEVNDGTFRVYLDDAKLTTKQEKVVKNGRKMKVPIYNGKVLTILVTYKSITQLSLRGEQKTLCKSTIDEDEFKLKIYGESQVVFNDANFNTLDVDIYGESYFTIKKGTVGNQKITVYGESVIDLLEIDNKESKLIAYGEAEFKIQASKRIKFTAYGEAELRYKGAADIDKGLNIGNSEIISLN